VSTLLPTLGVKLPDPVTPELLESTFPVDVPDFQVDLAIALRDGDGARSLVVLVEVQLLKNARKPPTWLLYQAAAQVRHSCDVVVLVIAPDAKVAHWARRPLPVGPSGRYAPVVLGPTDVPPLATLDVEHASPELAVLSLLAHGKRAERAVILRAARPILSLEPSVALLYFDLLCSILGKSFVRAVEDLMIGGEPLFHVHKKYYRDGKAEGRAEGKAEGRAQGLREALLKILTARGLFPTADQHDALVACQDLPRLERWLDAALRAGSVEEVLEDR